MSAATRKGKTSTTFEETQENDIRKIFFESYSSFDITQIT